MPFESLPELKLAYLRRGAGFPILFLQGVGLAGCAWQPQIERLASQFDCIAPDNRGVGESAGDTSQLSISRLAEDAVSLLERLGVARVHVVGHSMGGVIAQEVALLIPKRVASLTFMCTFSRGKEALIPSLAMIWHGLRTSVGSARMRRHAFARMVLTRDYVAKRGIEVACAELAEVFGRPLEQPPKVVSAQLRAMGRHDSLERLASLKHIPSLVFAGQFDPIARPAYGQKLAAALGSRYVEFNASHALPIELPDEVQREMFDHLIRNSVSGVA